MSDGHENDHKQLWLNQPMEARNMTLQLIQQKSRYLRTRTREKFIGSVAAPFAVGMIYVYCLKAFAPLQQYLHVMFAFALIWSLVGVYFLQRGLWAPVMLADAGVSSGLMFCRQEINRQRELVNRVLLWTFGPILAAVGTLIFALTMVLTDRASFPSGLPFVIAMLIGIAGRFTVDFREQRGLQREIEDLNDIERDSHTQTIAG